MYLKHVEKHLKVLKCVLEKDKRLQQTSVTLMDGWMDRWVGGWMDGR